MTQADLLKPTEYGLLHKFEDYLPGQAEAILSMEAQFKEGKRIVFCDAPTGSGKSLLAVVLAKRSNPGSALIVVQSKALQDQYLRDFPFLAKVIGRNNFECTLEPELAADEGLCAIEDFECEDKYSICSYYIQKAKAAAALMVTTNVAFFLTEGNLGSGQVSGYRDFLVLDEGHLLENSLMDFVSIALPERSLRLVGVNLPQLDSPDEAKDWAMRMWPLVSERKNTLAVETKGNSLDANAIRELLRYQRMTKRLRTLAEIEPGKWFLAENYHGYVLRPYLIDEFVEPLVLAHSNKTLMMSATFLNARVMSKLLGLDFEIVGWHQMDSNFPPERRPYNFIPIVKLSYRTKSVGYDRLAQAIDQILERHASEKGVIHTSSFKVMNEILARTRYPRRLIHHKPSSERLSDEELTRDAAIQQFLGSREPVALISPSANLGLDLHDDLARWQIIAKIPFASLADAQIKWRQEHDPEWYAWCTIAATVQACGRSTRHSKDWSTVYILDSALYILLKKYPYLFPRWWMQGFHRVENIERAMIATH